MNPMEHIAGLYSRWMRGIVGCAWASCTHFSHWRENEVSECQEDDTMVVARKFMMEAHC